MVASVGQYTARQIARASRDLPADARHMTRGEYQTALLRALVKRYGSK